jgi:hypothetical protein
VRSPDCQSAPERSDHSRPKNERLAKLTWGYQFVKGVYPGIFPEQNIFQLLVHDLPAPNVVLNDKQVMALLVQTIRRHPQNVHGAAILQRFGEECLENISRYALQTRANSAGQISLKLGLKRAWHGLSTGGLKIVERKTPYPIEITAYTKKRCPTLFNLFAFGSSSTLSDDAIRQAEDLNYIGYMQALQAMRSG